MCSRFASLGLRKGCLHSESLHFVCHVSKYATDDKKCAKFGRDFSKADGWLYVALSGEL